MVNIYPKVLTVDLMNLKDLKELAIYIKKIMKCSMCNRRYPDAQIAILAVLPTECVFQLDCPACKQSTIVNAGLSAAPQSRAVITQQDVMEMRNFLKEFNGDFKNLFNSIK